MASPHTTSEDSERLAGEFNSMRQHVAMLQDRSMKMSSDLRAHERVFKSLSEMEDSRAAFRLVGDALVKQTVGEVRPHIESMLKSIQENLKVIEKELESRQATLVEFQAKHKIRVVRQ
eukprot:gnl/Dysnectes_brevis/51_a62_14818.p1 GENE.gnl/Dysnectes_brevis/51_a62_14818~~gnl/Dysnectes_brevis/51_a62_14818.p1  ORF type:complete len:118 (+),score=3.82 gnl/Dysnectes_brevis/51_a62_14818:73-426(+)